MHALLVALLVTVCVVPAEAQSTTKKSATRPPAKPAATTKIEPAQVKCPTRLGDGVSTGRAFCDVLSGRDPAEAVVVVVPPHTGTAVLKFELHNRHTYSEQQVKAGRAFAEYAAVVGVLSAANEVLAQAAVRSTFRAASDLFDRVAGGAGPGGVKAVAPIGAEPVRVEVPQDLGEVRLVGERLVIESLQGRETFSAPGRPIAIVSNVTVEYRPPPRKAPTRRSKRR